MQTFLPYEDFQQSAHCLDYRRLGKQRVETLQILNALIKGTRGWSNHPAVKMWEGYTTSLAEYGWHMCQEWIRRGYKDTCAQKIIDIVGVEEFSSTHLSPLWIGNQKLHASHRSNLLRKDPSYYRQFGWFESDDLPYFWPSKEIKS